MPRFLKTTILGRYLFREILNYFLIFFSITFVILVIAQFYDMRNRFLENSPPISLYLKYLLYSTPEDLTQVLPLIALISTMFSYGLLAKNKEVLAMVAAGLSFRRLAMPAVVFGLGITVLLYWFNESVVPTSIEETHNIEQAISGKTPTVSARRKNVMIKGSGSDFIFMERYLINSREMVYPTIYKVNAKGGGLDERLEADLAVLVKANDKGNSIWRFENAEIWRFAEDGSLVNYQKLAKPITRPMGADLDTFLSRAKDPTTMNSSELREYIRLVEGMGSEKLQQYKLALDQKLAFPLACLLLALLGYSVVVDVHARRFAQGVFGGLLITVIFYVCNAVFNSVAKGGALSPMVASWVPIVLFIILNIVLMRRLNRVRG